MIPNLFFSFQVYSNLPVTAAKPNFLVTPKQLHEFYEVFQINYEVFQINYEVFQRNYEVFQINFGTQYESVKHLNFFH